MKKQIFLRAGLICSVCVIAMSLSGCLSSKDYKDISLPAGERAALLLKEMTLEEKIGQMCQYVAPSHADENSKKDRQNKNVKKTKTGQESENNGCQFAVLILK